MKEIEETPVAQKEIKKAISPDELKYKTNMKLKLVKAYTYVYTTEGSLKQLALCMMFPTSP